MSVILLSGPIGAGKTTVAKELLSLLKAPACYIEGDNFWSVFVAQDAKQQRERFRLIMRSMTAAAVPLARGGFQVLVDFSFPLDFLETARKIVKEIPLDFVILRPSLAVCEQRALERTVGRIADYSRYRDFYEMFEGRPQNEVRNDALDARSAAVQIRAGLDSGVFRVE